MVQIISIHLINLIVAIGYFINAAVAWKLFQQLSKNIDYRPKKDIIHAFKNAFYLTTVIKRPIVSKPNEKDREKALVYISLILKFAACVSFGLLSIRWLFDGSLFHVSTFTNMSWYFTHIVMILAIMISNHSAYQGALNE